ncbi:TIGR02453 family protein [Roseiarcaceae bacterium H3SJ34-1]|uniref:TIGR02453 family protein n=1 Tax=Terripilifer ovatus TaxID=3032367 RepID=UPI003AB96712|nr:TIGR02453 family protein [Roseiarcaceae bacterium H3SJ34-1]
MPAKTVAPAFPGFVPETLKFLKALGFHQTREWFEENRALYVSAVKDPLEGYVAALSQACAARKIPLHGAPKRATFRLNRDVRFSKDKKPYKTNAGRIITRTGLKGSPGLVYTHISPEGCFFAAGFYHPEPEQLAETRKAIVKKPAAWLAVQKKLADAGLELSMNEALKRNPQGFPEVDPGLVNVVRARNFIVRRPLPDKLLLDGGKLVEAAAAFAKDALPLLQFGWKTMG